MNNAHCLVTGASGFIGRRLTEVLAESGKQVACLVRRSSAVEALQALPVRLCRGDVATGEGLDDALEGIDVVYHLAGTIRALRSQQYHDVNAEGVRRILKACARRSTPPIFVLVSSIAVAGPSTIGVPVNEDDPPRPVSEYGRSKLAGEAAAREFADRVPTTIVRPSIVFGAGDLFTLQWFHSIARFGVHPTPCARAHLFSLIHIDDLVALLRAAAERGDRIPSANERTANGRGVYFAAFPGELTYRQVGVEIASAMGSDVPWTPRVPLFAFGTYALFCEAVGRVIGRPPWIGLDKFREARAGSWICRSDAAERLKVAFPEPLATRFRETAEGYRRLGLL